MHTLTRFVLLGLCLTLAACNSAPPTPDLATLLAQAERSAADQERDARSQPVEVLGFFGIEPGMAVADVFAGGGYYSEVLSIAVGPQGSVISHNNTPYARFAAPNWQQRLADDRLPNVTKLVSEADALNLPAGLDAIIMIMSFHDTYWVNEQQGWPAIDTRRSTSNCSIACAPAASWASSITPRCRTPTPTASRRCIESTKRS